uniref:Uncharacterized protein n=1 Tax=Oryza brachyantha TaxID=4533 RepID=J3L1H2_ORYBR
MFVWFQISMKLNIVFVSDYIYRIICSMSVLSTVSFSYIYKQKIKFNLPFKVHLRVYLL